MQPWILELVGYAAKKPAAQDILEGSFEIPTTFDPHLGILRNALRMPEFVRQAGTTIYTDISLQDHIQGWRRQKERTGSVRTALGFLDHIAAMYHNGMAEIDRLLRKIPYAAGFSPAAYQKITDFTILKRPECLTLN
jgi:hypothetical protein